MKPSLKWWIPLYSNLKALFVLKISEFLSWHVGHAEKTAWLKKYQISFKGKIKFGQLIEYNKRNIFLGKSCSKWGKETSSRPSFVFLKSLKAKANGL